MHYVLLKGVHIPKLPYIHHIIYSIILSRLCDYFKLKNIRGIVLNILSRPSDSMSVLNSRKTPTESKFIVDANQ